MKKFHLLDLQKRWLRLLLSRRFVVLLLCCSSALLFCCSVAMAAPFVDNGNGTVTDNKTGLMWQQGESGAMTWQAALDHCENLELPLGSGQRDWRLPNIKELESITDDMIYDPDNPIAIDRNFFPNAVASGCWSSTTDAGNPSGAWDVYFGNGSVGSGNKDCGMYVRCVRGGQSGSLGNLDHFDITDELGGAITDKSVGQPFQIKITAKNADGAIKTGWTGTVFISAPNGGLSPYYITISTGGTVTPWVSIDTPINNIRISAMGGGVSGASNAFSVTGAGLCNGGTVGGKVKRYKTPLSGATVYLTGYSQPTTSGSDGSYSFANVPPGSYKLRATYNDGGESREIPITVGCGGTAMDINVYQQCNLNEKTPVLLVPGIAGSTWAKAKIDLIPTLPRDKSPEWNDPDLVIYDNTLTTDSGWMDLRETLIANGYIENCTFFDVPYDWRKDIDTVANEYLRNWITEAKTISGSPIVNVIAHSMGGLVTRAYIQGYHYNYDVDRFAMIATPNHGSANAYYIWEGGDPETLDETVGSLLDFDYQAIMNYLVFGTPVIPFDIFGTERRIAYDYIQENVPSMWQLMPTYSYLDPLGSSQCITNGWLADLNSNNISRLSYATDTTTGKVRTKLFYSNSKSTIETINTGKKDCSKLYYPDGDPNGAALTNSGDTTVLGSSASLSSEVSITEDSSRSGEHSKLVATYAFDAVVFINDGQAIALSKTAFAVKSAPTSSLSIAVTGRAQPLLIAPSGQKSGVDNGSPVSDIPGTEQSIGVDAASIGIESPADGTYTVRMSGVFNADYRLIIGYAGAAGESSILSVQGFNHANTTSFTFTLNATSTNKLTMNHTPLPPTGLQADAVDSVGLKTRLTWDLGSDPEIEHYNIYSKYFDEPYLSQAGTSTTNAYDTEDAWAENSSVKTRIYAVSAVKADGTESFLSNMAENNDRDHDGLTDEEEASLGTNPDNPDSDGDGLKDGEEYIKGTSISAIDTDEDGYNDYQEIQSGTDPLDKYDPVMYGDCNGDNKVDAGDITALVLEIFDGDGNLPGDASGGTFSGNPMGSDANGDGLIDAGDIACTVLTIFNGPGACGN